jgi:hypothetical protein
MPSLHLAEGSAVNALALLLLLVPSQPKDPAPDTKAEAEEANALAKKLVGEFVVEFETAGKKVKLDREAEPAMRWTNHLGRRFYGDVFVWTYKGRPEVVASVNNVFGVKRGMEAEIVSVSTGRPLLTHNEKAKWNPDEAGAEFKPLPGAPKPGATPAARLLQMRNLAAQFAVGADYGIDKEMKEDLRLMAAPIFRYQSDAQDVVDGGLFAFTKGTDPDALLLIEARKVKDGVEWQYAFARLNGWCSLRGAHKDNEVWKVERQNYQANTNPKGSYYSYFGLLK